MIRGVWRVTIGPNAFLIPDVGGTSDALVLELIRLFSKRQDFGYEPVKAEYTSYAQEAV